MNNRKEFFRFVIPSVIAFALSGIYAIVDGFFVGNTIGDAGLSAINMAYPIVAFIQAVGTGIGMGGAVYYSINKAENNEKRAGEFAAASWWLLVIASLLLTVINYFFAKPILSLLGMQGEILSYGVEYIKIIALGATLQVLGTGMVPLMRNYGGSFMAMVAMVGGFVTNIIFDYIFVWVEGCGMGGAALATVIGQGVTASTAIIYSVYKKRFFVKASLNRAASTVGSIFKVGLAPFGLALTPNISLVIINIFSVQYGGDKAVATYACIGYIICIIYLVLQGVGDGCQPLMSQYYGEKREADLKEIKKMAYIFAVFLAVLGCALMFLGRWKIGVLFGSSQEVNISTGEVIPIFLIAVPFVAVTRVSTASFYATEKSIYSYILTFIEPVLMLVFMLILPPIFGGQIMIWWSTVIARIASAALALYLTKKAKWQA